MLQPYRASMLGCLGDANRWETTDQMAIKIIKENLATLGKSTFGYYFIWFFYLQWSMRVNLAPVLKCSKTVTPCLGREKGHGRTGVYRRLWLTTVWFTVWQRSRACAVRWSFIGQQVLEAGFFVTVVCSLPYYYMPIQLYPSVIPKCTHREIKMIIKDQKWSDFFSSLFKQTSSFQTRMLANHHWKTDSVVVCFVMMPGVGVLIALAAGYWIFKKHPVKKVSQVPHFKGLGGFEWALIFCQRSVQIGKVALTRTRRVPYCCQAQGYDIKNSTMQIDPTNKKTNISEPFGKMYF